MSIFSNIRKSRKSAKEHAAKAAEQKKKEEEQVPYRHVPTHAALDAIASAPPAWREAADRPKILEHNRRRSAMAASPSHFVHPGIPRVGSSLSQVSYPSDFATHGVPGMARAHSYTGISPYPDMGRAAMYSVPDMVSSLPGSYGSYKGKEAMRRPNSEMIVPRFVPDVGKAADSPSSGSSNDSSSSQEELEMRSARAFTSIASTPTTDRVHRLHPSRRRRTSDGSMEKLAMANSARSAGSPASPRDHRPPPSTRGFSSIPPGPLYQPQGVPLSPTQGPMSSTGSLGGTDKSSRSRSSSLSKSGTVPSSPLAMSQMDASQIGSQTISINSVSPGPGPQSGTTAAPSDLSRKEMRTPRATKFQELERIESVTEPSYFTLSEGEIGQAIGHETRAKQIVNVFPEPIPMPDDDGAAKKAKSKKFGKGGGKLLKKSRAS